MEKLLHSIKSTSFSFDVVRGFSVVHLQHRLQLSDLQLELLLLNLQLLLLQPTEGKTEPIKQKQSTESRGNAAVACLKAECGVCVQVGMSP